MKRKIFTYLALALGLGMNGGFGMSSCGNAGDGYEERGIVREVVDGDTVKVEMLSGDYPCYYKRDGSGWIYVRLMGIDTPEDNDEDNEKKLKKDHWTEPYEERGKDIVLEQLTYCSGEAISFLEGKLMDEEVILVRDSGEPDIDRYERPLRYVINQGENELGEDTEQEENMSLLLAKQGYGVMYDKTECSLCSVCGEIYEEVLKSEGCIWE